MYSYDNEISQVYSNNLVNVSTKKLNKLEACVDLYNMKSVANGSRVEYNIYLFLLKDIKALLNEFGLCEMSVSNICHMLHEDVNTLDFYVNFYSYRKASFDVKTMNELEQIALEHYNISEMHYLRSFYDIRYVDKRIPVLKKKLGLKISKDDSIANEKEEMLNTFFRDKLKPFVMNLNAYLATQFIITEDGIVPEESYLTEDEMFQIYIRFTNLFKKYVDKEYYHCFYKAICQSVINRYK
ncbi:MAG: hypothetical protein MSH08_05915 [Ezakiella sp.]|nr:hypothetical protein [Ezakiella sp.]MDD7471861.1 hypothetical protein [Bacillota bacterium]MDY3923825.1 hypothetical protein [Ezakiella sp.]